MSFFSSLLSLSYLSFPSLPSLSDLSFSSVHSCSLFCSCCTINCINFIKSDIPDSSVLSLLSFELSFSFIIQANSSKSSSSFSFLNYLPDLAFDFASAISSWALSTR